MECVRNIRNGVLGVLEINVERTDLHQREKRIGIWRLSFRCVAFLIRVFF